MFTHVASVQVIAAFIYRLHNSNSDHPQLKCVTENLHMNFYLHLLLIV